MTTIKRPRLNRILFLLFSGLFILPLSIAFWLISNSPLPQQADLLSRIYLPALTQLAEYERSLYITLITLTNYQISGDEAHYSAALQAKAAAASAIKGLELIFEEKGLPQDLAITARDKLKIFADTDKSLAASTEKLDLAHKTLSINRQWIQTQQAAAELSTAEIQLTFTISLIKAYEQLAAAAAERDQAVTAAADACSAFYTSLEAGGQTSENSVLESSFQKRLLPLALLALALLTMTTYFFIRKKLLIPLAQLNNYALSLSAGHQLPVLESLYPAELAELALNLQRVNAARAQEYTDKSHTGDEHAQPAE